MAEVSPSLVITLSVNQLNSSIKRQNVLQKRRPIYMLSIYTCYICRQIDTKKDACKRIDKGISRKQQPKGVWVAILLMNKIEFESKIYKRQRRILYIGESSVHPRDITSQRYTHLTTDL